MKNAIIFLYQFNLSEENYYRQITAPPTRVTLNSVPPQSQRRANPKTCGAIGFWGPFSFVTFLLGKQKKSKLAPDR
jgi:hypothetical protein